MAKAKAPVKKKAASKKTAPAAKSRKKVTKPKEPVLSKNVEVEIVDNSPDFDLGQLETDRAYAVPHQEAPEANDTYDEVAESESHEEPKSSALVESSRAVTSSDPLVLYLNEIRRYKVLSREEELALAKKYFETKDPELAQDLVKANLRFVVKVAAEYSKFGAKMIDLIQEGNVGLMHAVREFNPYKGARLITYAVWWIKGYIQEYLMRQYSMVRIGTTQNQRKLFYQLQKEKEALDAMGIEPNASLISSRLGIPEDEVRDMAMRMSGRDVSLDRPLDNDSDTSLGDLQKSHQDEPLDEALARAEMISMLKDKIEEIRPTLTDREIVILDERILADDPLTLQEIGEKYGTTREAVRQMEARVLKKIKAKMEESQ